MSREKITLNEFVLFLLNHLNYVFLVKCFNMLKLFFVLFCFLSTVSGQPISKSIYNANQFIWKAKWISYPAIDGKDYGVYHFRKTINIAAIPDKLIVNVSADNRYRLYINGKAVSMGPERGDIQHWKYETVDIAPFLKIGKNVIAALVFNMGDNMPMAQISLRTAFVFSFKDTAFSKFNTGISDWKVMHNKAYSPLYYDSKEYYVVGVNDRVDGSLYPWGWEEIEYDDQNWTIAENVAQSTLYGFMDGQKWMLVPRSIAPMEESRIEISKVLRSEGIDLSASIKFNSSFTVPANSKVQILLDQEKLSIGYPELIVNAGKGSSIKLSFAEALFKKDDKDHLIKGNRNEIEGKTLIGNTDIFLPDGGDNRLFRPLWLRTFRFIQIDIETKSEPLIIKDFYHIFTAYPFQRKASFECDDSTLMKIWETGWLTARICAGETYFDCPYYEQLMYVGDTRIQALISMYLTGDDRLVRKALKELDNSRLPLGLTQSRYPSSGIQIIPPFSLFWVDMIYDHYSMLADTALVNEYLPGIRTVLAWFIERIDTSGLFKSNEWWYFTDWTPAYTRGTPHGAYDGVSSVINLQLVAALQNASVLFDAAGKAYESERYAALAESINQNVYRTCFVNERFLIAQTPQQELFSTHANIFAILTGCLPDSMFIPVLNKLINDSSLIPSSIYFKFYLFRAIEKAGRGDLFLSLIADWKEMLNLGMTTFGEELNEPRSDCHAWSASPIYEFLRQIAGIKPISAGFQSVLIEPQLGYLKHIKVAMPCPKGTIELLCDRKGKESAYIETFLPEGMTGILKWNGKEIELISGKQVIFVK